MNKEEWKEIKNTMGYYSISNRGRVKSNRNNIIMKPIPITKGYVKVNIKINGHNEYKLIHRLVAESFIDNPYNKPEVNHKNGVKTDNRVENLEWVTGEENRDHAKRMGLQKTRDERKAGYLYRLWHTRHKLPIWSDEWSDYLVFWKWCISHGYKDGKHIARRSFELPYSPSNCYISDYIIHPRWRNIHEI